MQRVTDIGPSRIWARRVSFAALVLLVIFFNLLPLQTLPRSWAGPDLLMAFAFAWVVRRPEFVPPLLLGGLFLLADLLLQRPPGLWALLMVLACERLRGQSRSLRDATLTTEFLAVGSMIIVVSIGYRFLLALFMLDLPPLGLALSQLGMTLVFYPLTVFLTHALLGVRKATPGDYDSKGQAL
ncbi:MAG: rod shape-determining protein MreD [Pseudomonadota bacterium]